MKPIILPIEFDNDIQPLDLNRPAPGVFFDNTDSMFKAAYFSEPLTTYAVGWKDPNDIEKTLDFVAPPVVVGRRFEYKAGVNSEEWGSELVDDIRAIYGDFKLLKFTQTDVTSKTLNRGLTIICDLDEEAPAPGWQNRKVEKLLRRLRRNSLRRAVAAIDGSAVNSDLTWDTAVGNNPDADIETGLLAATDLTGIRPNRVIYGDKAWHYRRIAYGAQNNPAGYAARDLTPESLAAQIQVDRVMVSKERYQSSSSAKTAVLGAKAYAWFAQDGVDREDPSNIKRFVSSFDSEQGGGLVRVFQQQLSAKLMAISVEFYELIVITYSTGIRKFSITGP